MKHHLTASLTELLLAPLAGLQAGDVPQAPQKPNILFAIADNWSYGHAGACGSKCVKTPAMDPVAGYPDTDGGPTKTDVLKARFMPDEKHYWELCFGKLPDDQFCDGRQDSDFMTNLASTVSFAALQQQLSDELKQQSDPRMFGNGHLFDEYPSASLDRGALERITGGEKLKIGWISHSDFQPDED